MYRDTGGGLIAPAVAARQGGLAVLLPADGGAAFCCRWHPPQLPLQFFRHLHAKTNMCISKRSIKSPATWPCERADMLGQRCLTSRCTKQVCGRRIARNLSV